MKKFVRSFATIGAAAAIVLTASTGVRATEDQILWGDTNCTGDLDAADVMSVKRAIIGLPSGPMADPCADGFAPSPTDLNCNGEMDASDLVIIKRLLIELPVTLPEGCPN